MKFGNKYKNACHTYYKYLNSNNHLSESSQMQILTYNHNGASLSYDDHLPSYDEFLMYLEADMKWN